MGDVKLALLLGAMLGKLVAVGMFLGMLRALVPVDRPPRPARQGGPQDGHPVRAVPGARRASSPSSRASRSGTGTARSATEHRGAGIPLHTWNSGFPLHRARGTRPHPVRVNPHKLHVPRDQAPDGTADSSIEGSVADYQRPGGLRTAGQDGAAAPGQGLPGVVPLNEAAELLADLLGATGLLTADKLASARSRTAQGSLRPGARRRGRHPAARSRRRSRTATSCRWSSSRTRRSRRTPRPRSRRTCSSASSRCRTS